MDCRHVSDEKPKLRVRVPSSDVAIVWAIVVLSVLFMGEPDLKDALVELVQATARWMRAT